MFGGFYELKEMRWFFKYLFFWRGMLWLCSKLLPSMSSQTQVSCISTFQWISYIHGPSLQDEL